MVDLSTEYMGLKLSNPIIAGSSSLHKSVDGVKSSADAGAGAVVLKSLFEEQIAHEVSSLTDQAHFGHTEEYEYLSKMSMRVGPREYLRLIEESKRACSVPIIASLNCVVPPRWSEYASQLQAAGADALEVNAALLPVDPKQPAEKVEERYYRIVEEIAGKVSLPFAVKIGPYFSSLPYFASQLAKRGARALVLFNRFYQLDVDTQKLSLAPGYRFSSPEEVSLPLRWIAVLSGRVGCDLAASTGVHDAQGVIKLLLVGATAVQVCSVLYLKQVWYIQKIKEGLAEWMRQHNFEKLSDFRGKLSQEASEDQEAYERLQYIKVFVGIE